MNRRHFCIASIGAAVPLLATNRVTRGRISAITDEIARSQTDSIKFLRQYGLQWAELRGVPGARKSYADPAASPRPRNWQREFPDNGVKVSFLNASLLKHWLPGTEPLNPKHKRPEHEERFASRMDSLKRAIECAHILGVDKVRVFAFSRTKDPMALMPRLTDILSEMVEVAGPGKDTSAHRERGISEYRHLRRGGGDSSSNSFSVVRRQLGPAQRNEFQ